MSQRQPYVKLSDQQREALLRYYEEQGMTSTRKNVLPVIKLAAQEAGLSEERVKKWISNEKKKRTGSTLSLDDGRPSKKARLPAFKRGPSAYNVFCSEFFLSENCKGVSNEDKYRLAGEAWKNLSSQEAEKFKSLAKEHKFPDIDKITEETKKKLIKEHKKQMLEQAYFLEDLGCQSSILFLEDNSVSSGIDMGGSSEGTFFLRSNPSICMKFAQHFSAECKHYSYKDVQELFNEKYSTAMGKNLKVPYEKGGFKVNNLPQGIDFKKPSSYGKKQIELIMAAREKIKFEILPSSSHCGSAGDVATTVTYLANRTTTCTAADLVPLGGLVSSTIAAVLGTDTGTLATKTTPFEEADVEVESLALTQDQRLTLYASCRSSFSSDAWIAIGANMQSKEPEIPGIILPLYTSEDEKEDFWLFYTEENLRKIEKMSPGSTISGLWLDIKPGALTADNLQVYTLLHGPQKKVYGKNIIKSEHGPLYYFYHFDTSSHEPEQLFSMPKLLCKAIINILTLSGIIESDDA